MRLPRSFTTQAGTAHLIIVPGRAGEIGASPGMRDATVCSQHTVASAALKVIFKSSEEAQTRDCENKVSL